MTAANGTALEARLARLEQQVASLAAQAGGGEQLSPNYLIVDPNTGRVSQSRVLNVGDSFTWQYGGVSGIGQLLEELISGSPQEWLLLLASYAANVGDATAIQLQAQDNSGNPNAALSVSQSSSANAEVLVAAGGTAYKLIDQSGASDYLRVNPQAANVFAFGATTLTFAGSAFGSSPLINPGFGVPLTSVLAVADQGFGNVAITCTCHIANPGVSPNFQVEGYYPPGGLSASVTAYWMAAAS